MTKPYKPVDQPPAEDDVLRRMLGTPPKPHEKKPEPKPKGKKP